jgi:hypothetical protein
MENKRKLMYFSLPLSPSPSLSLVNMNLLTTQFSDLASITAAISITPTTFLLPVIMWNKKHGSLAPKWRLYLHYLFLFLSVLTAVVALVGAVADITLKAGA